jgi:hypothetical protein
MLILLLYLLHQSLFFILLLSGICYFDFTKKLADLDPKRDLILQAEQPPLSEVFQLDY